MIDLDLEEAKKFLIATHCPTCGTMYNIFGCTQSECKKPAPPKRKIQTAIDSWIEGE